MAVTRQVRRLVHTAPSLNRMILSGDKVQSAHTHTHTPMKSTFKLINLTRQGKVFGVRLQGRLKQTSKGRVEYVKKIFQEEVRENAGY